MDVHLCVHKHGLTKVCLRVWRLDATITPSLTHLGVRRLLVKEISHLK